MSIDVVSATTAFFQHTEEPIDDVDAWTEKLQGILADLYASAHWHISVDQEWPDRESRPFNRAGIEAALGAIRKYKFVWVALEEGEDEPVSDGDLVEDLAEIHQELAGRIEEGQRPSDLQELSWHWGHQVLNAMVRLHVIAHPL